MIPLRILCLHDAHSNAPGLQEQLGPLGTKLCAQHGIDLVYVNSPLVVVHAAAARLDKTQTENNNKNSNDNDEARVWWEETERTDEEPFSGSESKEEQSADATNTAEDIDDNDTTEKEESSFETEQEKDAATPKIHYRGLDASLMLIKQIWNSTPFFGIIGVGQGAAVASLFLSLLETENLALAAAENEQEATENLGDETAATVIPPSSLRQQALPQLAIFVCGESLVPVDEPILDTTDLAILHLVSAPHPTAKEEQLCQQFRGKVEQRTASTANTKTETSQNATTTLLDRHDWNIMGRFVVQQRKRLFGCTAVPSNSSDNGASSNNNNTDSAPEIVALQTALHLAEQRAADAVAEAIARNPPAALMAVIRPQRVVAGWNGSKRRAFGAEGGGAPCPSEFLLHRQQRAASASAASENGPSRVHPSTNNRAASATGEEEAASPAT